MRMKLLMIQRLIFTIYLILRRLLISFILIKAQFLKLVFLKRIMRKKLELDGASWRLAFRIYLLAGYPESQMFKTLLLWRCPGSQVFRICPLAGVQGLQLSRMMKCLPLQESEIKSKIVISQLHFQVAIYFFILSLRTFSKLCLP